MNQMQQRPYDYIALALAKSATQVNTMTPKEIRLIKNLMIQKKQIALSNPKNIRWRNFSPIFVPRVVQNLDKYWYKLNPKNIELIVSGLYAFALDKYPTPEETEEVRKEMKETPDE